MRFMPLQQDPPEHTPFRSAVTKGFAAKFIVVLEPRVTVVARELIDALVVRGECEFVTEFAEVLPLNIFLTLIGVPTEDRTMLRALGKQLTRPDGSMTPEQLRDAADDYLRPYVLARLERPGEDLFSRILAVPIEGRPWEYSFFVDFMGDRTDPPVARALAHLAAHTENLRILGSYAKGEP